MINVIAAIVFWLCSIYTATVSKTRPRVCLVCQINILFQNIIKFFGHFFSMYIICNWINIMEYSKREHSTINMLYSLTRICHNLHPYHPINSHLSTTVTFFCPQGGRYKEVQL